MCSKETGKQMPPLVIRGHHLKTFAHLLRALHPPSECAREATEDIESVVVFREGRPTNQFLPDREYIEDVLGRTPSQKKHLEDVQRLAFEMFLEMPDDFPVEIVTTKDVICGGCAIGVHCSKPQGDERYIDQFAKCLKPDQRKGVESSTGFPKKITTTLGVLRRVLEDPVWNLPRRPATS